MNLQRKAAVATGGKRSIGHGLCLELADEGPM
jgi:NAD(P)-dependent dehydrogenase (short-subunit alcohol dehydrogenase family)